MKLKLNLKRTKVGDINVINQINKYDSYLGGEQSGHIILPEWSNTGDGILAAIKITEIISKENKTSSATSNPLGQSTLLMDGIHIIQMMIKHMDTKIKLFLEYALSNKQSQKPDEDTPD